MIATIEIYGTGSFKGASSNLGSWSLRTDSTPLNPADSSGGVQELRFEAISNPDTPYLYRSSFEFSSDQGALSGVITKVSDSDGFTSVDAVSHISLLVADRTIPPYVGTLGGALPFYFAECGVPGAVIVDPTIADRVVQYPGGKQDMWTWIKDICAAQQIEMLQVFGVAIFRPVESTPELDEMLQAMHPESESLSVDDGDLAEYIEVSYYNPQYMEDELVYPTWGWNPDVQVLQVGAGEVTEADLQTEVSIMSYKHPIPVLWVDQDYNGADSVYAVAGNDGLPIQPQQWIDMGGDLRVELTDDHSTLRVTITAPSGIWAREYGPFRIAMASGSGGSDVYSSLRIMGTGVFTNEQKVVVPTGVEPGETGNEIGVTVSNRAVATKADAFDMAVHVVEQYGAPKVELTRVIAPFEGASSFAGAALFRRGSSMFRSRSADLSPEDISVTAEGFLRYQDLEERLPEGFTWGDFEDVYVDLDYREFSITPLPRQDVIFPENPLINVAWNPSMEDASASRVIRNVSTPNASHLQPARQITDSTVRGSYAARFEVVASGVAMYAPVTNAITQVGTERSLSFWVRPSRALTDVSVAIGETLGDPVSLPANEWTRVHTTQEASSTAGGRTGLYIRETSGIQVGDSIDIDAVMFTSFAYDGPYQDGDDEGWAWDGPPHASASHQVYITR